MAESTVLGGCFGYVYPRSQGSKMPFQMDGFWGAVASRVLGGYSGCVGPIYNGSTHSPNSLDYYGLVNTRFFDSCDWGLRIRILSMSYHKLGI